MPIIGEVNILLVPDTAGPVSVCAIPSRLNRPVDIAIDLETERPAASLHCYRRARVSLY